MRAARLLAAPALAAILLVQGRPCRAQSAADVDAARELFREGSRLALEGRWQEAQDRYARSLVLKRAAITLYSLGVAQRSTGQLAEALESFRAFLVEPATPTTAPYEPLARDAVAELERRVARIALSVDPPGAPGLAITIDGAPVPAAALDVPRLVSPGLHTIVATARGYAPARASVTSTEGTAQEVKLALAPASDEATPAGVPAAQPSLAAPARERPSRAAPIVLLSVGGAAVVAGVSVGLTGVAQASSAPTRNGPEAKAAKAKALAGDVVTGVGVAAAAAGLVVLLVRRPAADKPRAAVIAPWIGPSTAGLSVRF
jgi:hypothetical protein